MSSQVDTNINNYTVEELLTILDIDQPTQENVIEKTNQYIDKFDAENNEEMANFFSEMQDNLLDYVQQLNSPNAPPASLASANQQVENWYQSSGALKQSDTVQKDKITDRKQKIDIFSGNHVPMSREQLGVNNTYNVEVAQDKLNPNLKNITSRFINLDSQFRQATTGPESSSTDYTLDLSEPLNNTLSLRLYSVQIPLAWYAVDANYGANCFWIIFNNDINTAVNISIEPGNYSSGDFVNALNYGTTAFSDPSFNFPNPISASYPVSYSSNTGKITMNLYGATYGTETIDTTTQVLFFDLDANLQCGQGSGKCNQANNINQTLGWIMGYRDPYIYVDVSGNKANAILNLYGPKYLILAIDDYNQNHINNGLISITELSKNVKLPSYYVPSMPYYCPDEVLNTTSSSDLSNNIFLIEGNGLLQMEKMNISYKKIPQILPSAPRTLTQAQIYSINEIKKNNERNTNYRSRAPTTTDTFALIPIKRGSSSMGDVYVEFGGSMQDNKRIYFGPVNIDRMRVKLLDDKGNVLNMNGADWSCTLIAEILYQY